MKVGYYTDTSQIDVLATYTDRITDNLETIQEGDTLIVTNIVILARNLSELLKTLNKLLNRNIIIEDLIRYDSRLIGHKQSLENLVFYDSFYKDYQTKKARNSAVKSVKGGGRPKGLSNKAKALISQIKGLDLKKVDVKQFCKDNQISKSTFYNYLKM